MSLRRHYTVVVDRAVRTAAQSALLVLGAEQVNVMSVSWPEVGGFAAGGAVLSLLTSLVAKGVTGVAAADEF